jgi:hypothetical protein
VAFSGLRRIAAFIALSAAAVAPAVALAAELIPGTLGTRRPAASSSPRRPRLVLVWQDVHDLLGEDVTALAAEMDTLFAAAGVDVTWRVGGVAWVGPQGQPVEVQLVLLERHPTRPAGGRLVMGECLVRQEPPRTAWVYLDTVDRALGAPPQPPAQRSAGERRELIVALARVATHEVAHAVAADLAHARAGLMSPSLDRRALLQAKAGWDALSARTVRTRLAGLGGPPADGPAVRTLTGRR